jgi:predicted phage terminase large subunit-like protein
MQDAIALAADTLQGSPKPEDLEPLNFTQFVRESWPILEPGRDFLNNWSVEAIIDHLSAVAYGDIKKLVINVPPGSMKSLLTCVMLPAWIWGEVNPGFRMIFSSYANALAVRDSTKCRRLIKNPWYQRRYGHVFQILRDEDTKSKYENNRTGFRQCTSPKALGTGIRADLIVTDDPIKATEAASEKKRQFAVDWWNTEMSNRGSDRDARFIVIMQRLHEFDVAGSCIEQGYELLKIPQEYEPSNTIVTCLGWKDPRTEDGELMWPERFDEEFVESQQLVLGDYAYSGQHQQRPTPAEGGIIKRVYLEERYDFHNPPPFEAVMVTADTAQKPGVLNAYSVFLALGITQNKYYLIDVYRKKVDQPTLVEDFYNFCNKHKPSVALVEDKSSGAGLIQYAQKETRISVIPVKPEKDKETRLINESPALAARKLLLPMQGQTPWLFDLIDELTTAPNGEYMDQCFPPKTKIPVIDMDLNYNCCSPCQKSTMSLRNIENIQVGDKVFTHNGQWKKVLRSIENEFDGELLKVKPQGWLPVSMTPEHPVLCIRGSYYPSRTEKGKGEPEWIRASDLKLGDCVLEAIDKRVINVKKIDLAEITYRGGKHAQKLYQVTDKSIGFAGKRKIPRHINVDGDFCRLVGYFISEGSLGKRSIRFSFHTKETEYLEDVRDIVRNVFGIETCDVIQGNCHTLSFTSVILRTFLEQFGLNSLERNVPDWMSTLPKNLQIELLKGIFRGDGCITKNASDIEIYSYSTSSLKLVHDLKRIFYRLGIVPTLSVSRKNGCYQEIMGREKKVFSSPLYILKIAGQYASEMAEILGDKNIRLNIKQNRVGSKIEGGFVCRRIAKIELEPYTGTVYNLEVEEDNSYHTDSFVVHNCDALSQLLEYLRMTWQPKTGAALLRGKKKASN